jgi:hypothetical protein
MNTYTRMAKETAEREKVREQIKQHFTAKVGPMSAVHLIQPYEEANLQCLKDLLRTMQDNAYWRKKEVWTTGIEVLGYVCVGVIIVASVIAKR